MNEQDIESKERILTVKFIRFESETFEDVEFGTCELCFYTGTLKEEAYVFGVGTDTITIPTGVWCWGDYIVQYPVLNVVRFGSYINSLELDDLQEFEKNFSDYYYDYVEKFEAFG